ncbi:hypothetical protein PCC7424_4849 [Gloeothece citriformis PCC 7424]|uniref:Uncharacterized protein n=1 Tax=Gloeothece citriformis (strain PCC 7424) TaxID=65393 RepID=B7KE88_GLOC7|nr:hypothetical protein [Gloeothece citriformis]ACK73206.1 hypothetical protein PCC7424_4849 [Gloeothece citriformis PCC 7424]
MSQIQITDLIGEAVANATERRKQGMADLNADQLNTITGGAFLSSVIIAGMFPPIQTFESFKAPSLTASFG